MTADALPKAGSQAFKALWERLKRTLDVQRAALVIDGVLDRQTLEALVQKLTPQGAGRLQHVDRLDLVGRLAAGFWQRAEAAHALMRELDRLSHKERFMCASIAGEAIAARIESYRAVDFRRERGRMIWALLRDARAEHQACAEQILAHAFAEQRKNEQVAALKTTSDIDDATLDLLKQRLSGFEQTIGEQQATLKARVDALHVAERERSELLLRLSRLEQASRDDDAQRRAQSAEVQRLTQALAQCETARISEQSARAPLADADQQLRLATERDTLVAAIASARTAAEHHANKVAVLVDQAKAQDTQIQQLRKERDVAHKRCAELDDALEKEQRRTRELREALAHARKPTPDGAATSPRTASATRVGLFVDAANMSASARRAFGDKLDYQALKRQVMGERQCALALAFVVRDTDSPAHFGFVSSLRDAGYDVREKAPRVFADGNTKADWDMEIAMSILDALDDLDTVVLCSGDGDFVPLIKRAKRNVRVEVAAFRGSADDALARVADAFWPLDASVRLIS